MALAAAEQAPAINSESAEAEYLAGAAALGASDASGAEAHFQRALKLAPGHFRALAGLLDAQLRLNRADQAAVTLAEIDRRLGEHDTRRVQIAELLVGRSAYGLAVQEFEALHKADPKSYEFGYDLALAYHRAGEDGQASTFLENLLAQKDAAELEDLLGEVEQSRGSANKSLPAFRRAVELDPRNENYVLHFGQALVNRGSLNEAVAVFAVAAKDLPKSSQMWMAWGGALYILGKFTDSAEKLLHAAKIAPKDPRVYFLLGRAYGAAGPYRDAIAKEFARHVSETPNDAWAQYFYGRILAERSTQRSSGDLDEAQLHVEKALALDGSLAEAHAELGNILDTRGHLDAARRELEEATRLDPNSSIAFYRLAHVYQELGQTEQARAAIAKFQQLKNEKNRSPVPKPE
jgi:tetratricopeptide (TPR) repeat protein